MKDILITDDIAIKNGDFEIGESEHQEIKHILKSNKGEFKSSPELGVGIENIINTDDATPILIDAKKNLEYDGFKVNNIKINEKQKLIVNAKRN